MNLSGVFSKCAQSKCVQHRRGFSEHPADQTALLQLFGWRSFPTGQAAYFELASHQVCGKTLLAKVLRNTSVAIDVLERLPEVDPRRTGFVGIREQHSFERRSTIDFMYARKVIGIRRN